MPPVPPAFWNEMPQPDASSARDGLRFHKTADLLFVGQLLNRANDSFWIQEQRGPDRRWHYSPLPRDQRRTAMHGFVKVFTVRKTLCTRFYALRASISAGGSIPWLDLDGKPLRREKGWVEGQPWLLGASLRHPFEQGSDPFLHHFQHREFFKPSESLDSGGLLPMESEGRFCPVDGPVIPLKAKLRTSSASWSALAGREWELVLCPCCLGVFEESLSVIS